MPRTGVCVAVVGGEARIYAGIAAGGMTGDRAVGRLVQEALLHFFPEVTVEIHNTSFTKTEAGIVASFDWAAEGRGWRLAGPGLAVLTCADEGRLERCVASSLELVVDEEEGVDVLSLPPCEAST